MNGNLGMRRVTLSDALHYEGGWTMRKAEEDLK